MRANDFRRRRCRLVLLAMALGVLLPVFSWSWITFGAAVAGITILALLYRRECWHMENTESAPSAPDKGNLPR